MNETTLAVPSSDTQARPPQTVLAAKYLEDNYSQVHAAAQRFAQSVLRKHNWPLDRIDDLVGDTELHILTSGALLDPEQWRPWVCTSVKHTLVDWSRNQRAMKRGSGKQPVDIADCDAPDTRATDGDERRTTRKIVLGAAKQLLPRRQRQVIVLTFRGLEPTEIAKKLGKKPATVRSWLFRAGHTLQQKLGNKIVF